MGRSAPSRILRFDASLGLIFSILGVFIINKNADRAEDRDAYQND